MTAAINNRSSIFSAQTEEVASAPQKSAAAAPPAIKQESARGNRVEAWSGLPAAQQQAPRTADQVVADIEKKMKTGSWAAVRDFAVTERDARDSVAMLGQLPAPEYQKALEKMNSTALGQLLSEMDADTRKTFFAQARQKGALVEEPAVKAPPREGSAPDKPAMLRNDPSMRTELRDAVHSENKARTHQYMRDFEAYVSRYSEAALKASSPLALRLMGPPQSEFTLYEPGRVGKDYQSLEQGTPNRSRAAKAVNDRISDFAGRTRAGSYSATFEAKAGASFNGVGVESTVSARVTDYGKVTVGKLKGDAALSDTNGSIGLSSEGKVFQKLGAKGFSARFEGGKVTELEGKLAGVGVKLTEDKTTLSMGLDNLPIGTFADIDEKGGSYGGGVKLGSKQKIGGLELELSAKVGFAVQGVAPERLAAIASMVDDGIWGPMPELDRVVQWKDIPKARRERLASDGWSPSNWPVR